MSGQIERDRESRDARLQVRTRARRKSAQILTEVKRLESEGYEFEAAEASFELLIRKHARAASAALRAARISLLLPPHRRRRVGQVRGHGEAAASTARQSYTVAEGDGPVNALDAALRKALRPFYPADRRDRARGLQGPHHQRPAGHRRPHPRAHRLAPTATTPGARSA